MSTVFFLMAAAHHLWFLLLTLQVSALRVAGAHTHTHTNTLLSYSVCKAPCDAVEVLSKATLLDNVAKKQKWVKVRNWPWLLSCWHWGEELWLEYKHAEYHLDTKNCVCMCVCFFSCWKSRIYFYEEAFLLSCRSIMCVCGYARNHLPACACGAQLAKRELCNCRVIAAEPDG